MIGTDLSINIDLSIIIVNYNTYELTKNTINSVLETTKTSYEIFLLLIFRHRHTLE